MIVMSASVMAGEVQIIKYFQSWVVIKSDDGKDLIAVTANDAEHYIGFRCFSETKQCVHVLSASTICVNGGSYPILINSDFSPMSMDAVCRINGKIHELLLTQYDSIHKILQKGSNIGFAIPMQSGQFKVVRFSLLGSEEAMEYVERRTSEVKEGEQYL